MSIGVTFPSAAGQGGSGYTVPEPGDVMTQSMTDYLVALASKSLAAPTAADLDLGASFSIKAIYFKTRTANPAAAGVLRLANADTIGWRNAANNADLAFAIDAGGALTFGGANVTGNPMLDATTAAGQSISNSTTTIVVFGTTVRDSDSAYNAGTGRYTIPAGKGGDYLISAAVQWNAACGANPAISIYKNAASLRSVNSVNSPGTLTSMVISAVVNLAAGDVIDIRVTQASGGAVVLSSSAGFNYFTLKRIPT